MFSLTFKSDYSDFTYEIWQVPEVEWSFRHPRVSRLVWTFDGEKWVSCPAVFEMSANDREAGHYEVARVA